MRELRSRSGNVCYNEDKNFQQQFELGKYQAKQAQRSAEPKRRSGRLVGKENSRYKEPSLSGGSDEDEDDEDERSDGGNSNARASEPEDLQLGNDSADDNDAIEIDGGDDDFEKPAAKMQQAKQQAVNPKRMKANVKAKTSKAQRRRGSADTAAANVTEDGEGPCEDIAEEQDGSDVDPGAHTNEPSESESDDFIDDEDEEEAPCRGTRQSGRLAKQQQVPLRQSTRGAAAAAQRRITQQGAATAGGGSSLDDDDDNDNEDGSDGEEGGNHGSGPGQSTGDGNSAGSDEGSDSGSEGDGEGSDDEGGRARRRSKQHLPAMRSRRAAAAAASNRIAAQAAGVPPPPAPSRAAVKGNKSTVTAGKAKGKAQGKGNSGSKKSSGSSKASGKRSETMTIDDDDDDDDEGADSDASNGQDEGGRVRKDSAPAGKKDGGGVKKEKDTGKLQGDVKTIMSYDAKTDRYLVKYHDMSYREAGRVSEAALMRAKPQLLRMFLNRGETMEIDRDWLVADRIIAHQKIPKGRGNTGATTAAASAESLGAPSPGPYKYYVKWRSLEYAECTWENEDELTSEEDQAVVASYWRRVTGRTQLDVAKMSALQAAVKGHEEVELPGFCNGRQLRDYQQLSVRWMLNNFVLGRNCILGDEMGLGKTAQSIAVLECLRALGGVPGPFLIIAPLTTLGHWKREVETWTDMNVVLFAGNADDRDVIEGHELWVNPNVANKLPKFTVLLASYDMLLKEKSLFRSIRWAAAVFDEAHKLKGLHSSTRQVVVDLAIRWKLLLTGTPIQNNMLELFSIMNLLDPHGYPDAHSFLTTYGGGAGTSYPPPTVDQVKALQGELAPLLLRRMKEDVETLPEKEEVVIWVELTSQQRAYYKAVCSKQIAALLGGAATKNLPGMRNLAMELRKLCCHPFLCEGLEDDYMYRLEAAAAGGNVTRPALSQLEHEALVRASGKMVLLQKLLAKLRAEGRRVLIFSQFVIMLNLIEAFCECEGYPVERIDGNTKGKDRQNAIDRFSTAEGKDAFVFLLSTRAGGQGITLTSADTCIIYDSDWNPQNDLQAMARCHRIGQTKEVTVYRLVMRDTYEEKLFKTASRKYGLDEAILGHNMAAGGGGSGDPEADSARIAELLREGAHCLAGMEERKEVGEAFVAEDIEQILSGRTEKRTIGGRAGNTFSTATFAVEENTHAGKKRGGGAGEDRDFWSTYLPEAVAAHDAQVAAEKMPQVLGPRKSRAQINYFLDANNTPKQRRRKGHGGEEGEGSDFDGAGSEGGSDGEGKPKRPGGKRKPKRGGGGDDDGDDMYVKPWSRRELKELEDQLVLFAPGRWPIISAYVPLPKRTEQEVKQAGEAMLHVICVAAEMGGLPVNKPSRPTAAAAGATTASAKGAAAPAPLALPAAGSSDGSNAAVDTALASAGGSNAAAEAAAAPPAVVVQPVQPQESPDAWLERLRVAVSGTVPGPLTQALLHKEILTRLARGAPETQRHFEQLSRLQRLMAGLPLSGPLSAEEQAKMETADRELAAQLHQEADEDEQNDDDDGSGSGSDDPDTHDKAAKRPRIGKEGPANDKAAGGDGDDDVVMVEAVGPSGSGAAAVAVPAEPVYHCPLIPRDARLPSWWSRAHDDDLLVAAHKTGYYSSGHTSRKCIELALAARRLRFGQHVVPPPEKGSAKDAKDGAGEGDDDAKDKKGKEVGCAKDGSKDGGQKLVTAGSSTLEGQAGGGGALDAADAVAAAAVGTAGGQQDQQQAPSGPQQLDDNAWNVLIRDVGKRMRKVLGLVLHPEKHAAAPKPPVVPKKRPSLVDASPAGGGAAAGLLLTAAKATAAGDQQARLSPGEALAALLGSSDAAARKRSSPEQRAADTSGGVLGAAGPSAAHNDAIAYDDEDDDDFVTLAKKHKPIQDPTRSRLQQPQQQQPRQPAAPSAPSNNPSTAAPPVAAPQQHHHQQPPQAAAGAAGQPGVAPKKDLKDSAGKSLKQAKLSFARVILADGNAQNRAAAGVAPSKDKAKPGAAGKAPVATAAAATLGPAGPSSSRDMEVMVIDD